MTRCLNQTANGSCEGLEETADFVAALLDLPHERLDFRAVTANGKCTHDQRHGSPPVFDERDDHAPFPSQRVTSSHNGAPFDLRKKSKCPKPRSSRCTRVTGAALYFASNASTARLGA